MSDASSDLDSGHPSKAEGEDPADPEQVVVLQGEGRPSAAEGEDPDATGERHEVLDPAEPE